MKNYESIIESKRKELEKMEQAESILIQLEDRMHWDCMTYDESEDNEDGSHNWKVCDYGYSQIRYEVWQEIFATIEKKFF